ncbi:MAG: hypothetical protein EOO85_24370 [Pedobacter sp.]|nr:MAG: hypothetical protein EOO85_24370 [Pedobacter sp.]
MKSSTISIGSAIVNLGTTICIVRWFGAEEYSQYIIDLALISLIFLIAELVPNNYSIFKVQDDPLWLQSTANYAVAITFAGIALIFALSQLTTFFQAYSNWMLGYGITLSIKRYMDTRLQSSGRLSEFMRVEFFGASCRMVILIFLYLNGNRGVSCIWASLAAGSLVAQIQWCSKNPSEIKIMRYVACSGPWAALFSHRKEYIPYYAGSILKKIKDNFVPLAAAQLLVSRELLASFFLAYRGLVFSVGQIRILEALVNHRAALSKANRLGWRTKSLVAFAAQLLCLAASILIILLSGELKIDWPNVMVLSAIIWPLTFMILERAKAYSIFKASAVNKSILAYIIFSILGAIALSSKENISILEFSILLLFAEFVSLAAIWFINKKNDV